MKYMFQCVYHPILYTYIENFDKNREIENLGYNGLIKIIRNKVDLSIMRTGSTHRREKKVCLP